MSNQSVHIRSTKRDPLMIGSNSFISSNDYSLTEEELVKACLELGETEEKKKECLEKLKSKLSNDGNGPYLTDDSYLLRYLRIHKFDCEEAYRMLKNFYSLKKKHPDVFSIRGDLKSQLNLNFMYYLPYADSERRIVFILDFEKWNPREIALTKLVSSTTATLDVITMNPRSQVNGFVAIWDLKGLTLRHVAQALIPSQLMMYSSLFQHSYPLRMKLVIGFNCTALTRKAYNILRPLVKPKIVERIVLLGSDLKELHQYVNPTLLPKALGGTLGEEECSIAQHILDNMPYLEYERSFTATSEI